MIGVDTNILVYAHRRDSEWHAPARQALQSLANGSDPWSIPWPCIHEFVAVATHPRIFRPPTPLATALEQVDAWLESPSHVALSESDGYWATFKTLVAQGRLDGARVHDARIAALCLTHSVRELWTADRDFSLFPALRVRNPLVG